MVDRSLRASPEGIKAAKTALIGFRLTQQKLADALDVTRQPISKFFNGKPVACELFVRICERLQLDDWQAIAQKDDELEAEQNQNENFEIDALVQEIREKVKPNIQERCGTMRVLDMAQPIELTGDRGIYTNVNILEKITGRRRLDIAELLQNCEPEDFERFGLNKVAEERVPGLKAVQRYSKLMVLGKPGAGKTTFLKYLAMQCIERQFQANRVPLFITLKDFAEAPKQADLLEYIAQQFSGSGVTDASVKAEQLLRQDKVLVLLDGLDEVREEDTKRVLTQIRDVADQFHTNQFVITCRIAAKDYTFERFTEVEVADFDKEQIAIFAQNWFRLSDPVKAERFTQKLEENQPIQELATNPLLLTLLCLVFGENADFPANRSELYKEGLDVLLKKWDAKRNIERDQVYKNLSLQRKEDLLSQIALTTFEQKDYFFKQKTVEAYIAYFIRNLRDADPNPEVLRLDSEAVLKSIEAQHGLLVERAKGIYSFSHLTFQEYFTARAIFTSANPSAIDDEAMRNLVIHIYEKSWREVFFLFVGMVNKADVMLLLMKCAIDVSVSQYKELHKLLLWANQKAFEVSSFYKPATVRAFYICLAAGIYTIDNSTPDFLEDWYIREMSDLIEALDKTIFLDFYYGGAMGLGMGNPQGSLDSTLSLDLNLCNARAHASLLARAAKLEETKLVKNPDEKEDIPLLDDTNFYTITDSLYYVFNCPLERDLAESLLSLDNQLPQSVYEHWQIYEDWYKTKSESWAEELRTLINKHRNIDHHWQFSDQQWGMLRAYCYANKLLVDCLNSDCYVSREVRQEIEDTLLLPMSEIEKRQQGKVD
jgi:predicted NACHT family NTPase